MERKRNTKYYSQLYQSLIIIILLLKVSLTGSSKFQTSQRLSYLKFRYPSSSTIPFKHTHNYSFSRKLLNSAFYSLLSMLCGECLMTQTSFHSCVAFFKEEILYSHDQKHTCHLPTAVALITVRIHAICEPSLTPTGFLQKDHLTSKNSKTLFLITV